MHWALLESVPQRWKRLNLISCKTLAPCGPCPGFWCQVELECFISQSPPVLTPAVPSPTGFLPLQVLLGVFGIAPQCCCGLLEGLLWGGQRRGHGALRPWWSRQVHGDPQGHWKLPFVRGHSCPQWAHLWFVLALSLRSCAGWPGCPGRGPKA